jgi:hypothetical protein
MTIPLSGWAEFREEMEPYIKNAYEKVISFEEFDVILKQKMSELHAKYEKNQIEIVGKVVHDEIWIGAYPSQIADVENEKESVNSLLLDIKEGKRVKVTIEVLND